MPQKGFANVFIIIVLVGVFIGGVVFWIYYKSRPVINQNEAKPPSFVNKQSSSDGQQNDKNHQTTIRLSPIVNGNPPCTNSGRVTLTKPLINPDDLKAIWPLGKTVNGHVTPIDHQYFAPTDAVRQSPAEIRMPADGVVFGIGSIDASKEDPTLSQLQKIKYNMAIAFSCSEAVTIGYMTEVAPNLQPFISNTDPSKPYPLINIPMKAGQVLGKFGGNTDIFFVDTESKLSGFVDDGDYIDENWKPYSHSMADYYSQPLRDKYNAKSLRKVEPFGGKIDYDQPGKLIGNWFKEGILPHYMQQRENYWQNELAIFYDFIDPSQIRIMIGQFATDRAGGIGFDVVGNTPDPATISVNSGLVKYSLVNYTYADQSGMNLNELDINIDDMSADKTWHVQNEKSVWGMALVQMIEDRKIKFEVFPGKTADQVTGFTDKAIIYER